MLDSQKNFVGYLQALDAALNGSDFESDPELLEKVLKTELVVPVIGAFSAGKSSLLNTFLGQNVLPVGIAPETELATELRYSPEPCLVGIRPDGTEEHLAVEMLAAVNRRSSEFSHLRLYLDCAPLKKIAPLVLVDMPGYGSSLESHNKAIAFYLPRGVHFVVVTSVEDGNLTQSMIRRLDDVRTYGGDFTFVLSKCNLRAPEQVEEVRSYIDEQLSIYFGGEHKTLPVGKDGVESLGNALGKINPETLFDGIFKDVLKGQSHDLVRQISLAMNVLKKDVGQNESELRALEQALNTLVAQQGDMQDQVRQRYSGRLLNRCLRAVDADLNQALDELAGLAVSPNKAALGNAISEIIRSSLTSNIREEIDEISGAMIDDLSSSLAGVSQSLSALGSGTDWAGGIATQVRQSLEQTTQALSNWSDLLGQRNSGSGNMAGLYKGVSTILAVTTALISPVIELVLIFLPNILRWFSSRNERQEMRNKLQSEVIPGVKAELRSKLPAILDEQLAVMLAKVNEGFESKISQQKEIIVAYKQQRDAQDADINTRMMALEQLSSTIKALATQHLYA